MRLSSAVCLLCLVLEACGPSPVEDKNAFPSGQVQVMMKQVTLPGLPANSDATFKLSPAENESLAKAYEANAGHIHAAVQNNQLVFSADAESSAHLTGAEPEVTLKQTGPSKKIVLTPEAAQILAKRAVSK